MTEAEFTDWEDVNDELLGPRRQRFAVPAPPKDRLFRAIRDEWVVGKDGVDERTILKWELGPPVPEEDR